MPDGNGTPNDAATEFLPAAENFNASLGQVLGQAVTGLIEADAKGQQTRIRVLQAIVQDDKGNPRPPLDFVTQVNGKSGKEITQTTISAPLLALVENSQFALDEAYIELDMEVASHAEDNFSLGAQIGAEGEAGLGIGPFQANVKISANMSVDKSSKRASDYTSKTHAWVKMKRIPAPETLCKIVDSITETVNAGIDIQRVEAGIDVQKYAQAKNLTPGGTGTPAPAPAPAPDTGGGGNGGGGNNNPPPQ